MRRFIAYLLMGLVPMFAASCTAPQPPTPTPTPTPTATVKATAKPAANATKTSNPSTPSKAANPLWVAGMPGVATAKVKDAFGQAYVRTPGATKWKNINVGDVLPAASRIKTGGNSAVLLSLINGHIFRVGATTEVLLAELGRNKAFSFNVVTGQVWSLVQKAVRPTRYEVQTPSAVVGVSGTVFSVAYNKRTTATLVSTRQGEVTVRQGRKGTRVKRGQQTKIFRNQRTNPRAVPQARADRQKWESLQKQEDWLQGIGTLLSLRDYGNTSGVRRASAASGNLPRELEKVLSGGGGNLKNVTQNVGKQLLNDRLRQETRRLDPALQQLVAGQLRLAPEKISSSKNARQAKWQPNKRQPKQRARSKAENRRSSNRKKAQAAAQKRVRRARGDDDDFEKVLREAVQSRAQLRTSRLEN